MLEQIAVVFGLVSVFLSAREHIVSWPTGIINVALYAWIFFHQKLYADSGLQVVYLVLCAYGWYNWLHGGANHGELAVTRLTRPLAIRLTVIGVAGSLALGTLFRAYTDASLPYLDSTLSVFSLVAQYMMTKKIAENWLIWIAVDVVYVWMFLTLKPLYPTAIQYGVFLALASLGWIRWRRTWREGRLTHVVA